MSGQEKELDAVKTARLLAEELAELDTQLVDLQRIVHRKQELAENLWLLMDPKREWAGAVSVPEDRAAILWLHYDAHPTWGVGIRARAEGQELVLSMGPHELRVRVADEQDGGFAAVSMSTRKDDEG